MSHLRQLGRELPLAESPPADGVTWDPAAPTGRVVIRQSLGSGRPGYAWGVQVQTPEGAPVLLQPLPMRTRSIGLRLAAGDYVITTYRHGCVDGCERLGAPTRQCRSELHVEAEGVVELGESAPDRTCRLLHRPPPAEPALAWIGVRHMTADGGLRGWYLRASLGDLSAMGGGAEETGVALAPYVDALSLWVEAGVHTLETHVPGHSARAPCRSTLSAELGDAIEVVHTHGTGACRPYPTRSQLVSTREPVTAGDR